MSNELLIGVDVGTTAAKAGLFDLNGTLLEQAEIGYQVRRPRPDWAEQDPDDWWRGLKTILGAVAGGRNGDVRAIGICSQVNTHVFVDDEGEPVRPAIVWQDTRCAQIARSLSKQLPATASAIGASSAVARAEWVRQHETEHFAKTRRLLSPKDHLNRKLTGAAATDSLSSFDLVGPDGSYLPDVLSLVPGLTDLLPALSDFRALVGTVSESATVGLEGVPVAVATMDAWGSLYGSGAVSSGDGIYVAGTSEILGILSHAGDGASGVVAFPPVDGLTFYAGPTQAGGAALQWFATLTGLSIAEVLRRAESCPPGSDGLIFLPYLAGERAPLWNADARGVFFGLSTEHSLEHLCRAVLEGVAFSARHLLDVLETASHCQPDTLRISGGGSRSDLWCQIRADVLGRRLERTRVPHSGTLGAALIASVAADMEPSLQTATARAVHSDAVFEPTAASRLHYDELYRIYRDLYPALAPAYERLSAIRTREAQASHGLHTAE